MRGAGALLAVLLATAAAGQEIVPVSVEIHPEEITVGGRVRARLTLVWDGAEPVSEPRFPTWQESWGQAEVLEVGGVETFADPSGRRVYNQTLTLTAFEIGEIVLPPRTIAVPVDDATVEVPIRDGVRFTVSSVLPSEEELAQSGEELEARPAAPLERLEGGGAFLWTAAALAALCLLATWNLRSRLGRVLTKAIAARLLPSPWDEFRKNFGRIHPAAGAEPAATAMSFALRRYLGRRLHFNATEHTTSEIRRELLALLDQDVAHRAVALLRDSDQVKYAGLEVTPEVTQERLDALRQLAWEIEDAVRRAEVEEAAAEAAVMAGAPS